MELHGGCKQSLTCRSRRPFEQGVACSLADSGHGEKVCAANVPTDVPRLGKTLPVSVSLLLRISN